MRLTNQLYIFHFISFFGREAGLTKISLALLLCWGLYLVVLSDVSCKIELLGK